MEIQKAKNIVELLANGIDPITGELLPPNSPYNNPEIAQALLLILSPKKRPKKTIEEKEKENIENGKPKNSGLPWNDEARKEISTMFNNGKTIAELSEYFERTSGAIKSELKHQELIT